MNLAELSLLRKLEKEFQNNHGHSMRDLADRIERLMHNAAAGAVVVAENLVVTQQAVDDVAVDLAAGHARADAVTGHPGEASDAASRSPHQED
jgi:hypothetical protein